MEQENQQLKIANQKQTDQIMLLQDKLQGEYWFVDLHELSHLRRRFLVIQSRAPSYVSVASIGVGVGGPFPVKIQYADAWWGLVV